MKTYLLDCREILEMNMYSIIATEKPKWHNIRWKLSNAVVLVARWIYPENPEVKAFLMQVMTDQMIYGQAVTRIDPKEIFKTPNARTDRL